MDFAYHKYNQLADSFVAGIPAFPRKQFSGRGIVTSADDNHMVSAWVLVHVLRHVGCTLPVEIWHFENDISNWWIDQFMNLGVTFRATSRPIDAEPNEWSHDGYGLKVYAMLNCSFQEFLHLDTDIVPTRDPSYLFDRQEYQEFGSLFWPDLGTFGRPDGPFWILSCHPYQELEREFESGQLLVDKERCWRELNLTMHFNRNAHFYYRWIPVFDKDTFHLAWRKLRTPYNMIGHHPVMRRPPDRPPFGRWLTCNQHDPQGRLLFQHRVGCKWTLANNTLFDDFEHQDVCLASIIDLAARFPSDQTEGLATCDVDNFV